MMEAIILAGGKGTRLRAVLDGIPKPMAPVDGKPFLEYLIASLKRGGIDRVIMSVGYKHQAIVDHFGSKFDGINIDYVIEDEPLGTGGAIKVALTHCSSDYVFVVNGDTYFEVDYRMMLRRATETKVALVMAVKALENFDRYGHLEISDGMVSGFHEKVFCAKGFINGGIYCVGRTLLEGVSDKVFSFERDFLEKGGFSIAAFESRGYFIDIGIPSDYERAQYDLKSLM